MLDLIADKWAMLIVHNLETCQRYSELKSHLGGISHKVMTQTLRKLEHNSIVVRHVHPTVPPRVDYELTDAGADLLQTIHGLCDWARRNRPEIEAARTRARP